MNKIMKKTSCLRPNSSPSLNHKKQDRFIYDSLTVPKSLLTWLVERHGWRRMEEWRIMVERRAIAKLELAICCREVRKPRRPFLEPSWRQIHREPSHLAWRTEKRTPTHWSQLLETTLFRSLVLEPHLMEKSIFKVVIRLLELRNR